MKCPNCGFISNRDFYRCPYCGHVNPEEQDGLRTRVKIGNDFSVSVRTILVAVSLNLFGAALLADWYFDFRFSISLWAFILIFIPLTVVDISTAKKPNLISSIEKIDLLVLLSFLLACGLAKIDGLFDVRAYFPTLVIPAFLVIGTIASTVLLFKRKNSKVRPLWTELLLAFHLTVAIIIFTFFLINKYCVANGVSNPPFNWMQLGGMTKDYQPPIYVIEEILIFAAFGGALIYLINYNVILVGYIFRKVKNLYGGERD